MHYDPIKELLGRIFNKNTVLRRLFYSLLNVLLLRSWHVRKALRKTACAVPPTASVLDAGMGFGQYTWWMAKRFRGWTITAADIKSEQVDDCNSFFSKTGISDRVRAVETDLASLGSSHKYDLVLCVDVMEHIEEDRKVFSNFFNVLNPGGILIVSTPSDRGGSEVHGEGDASFIGEHVRNGYPINEINDKLHEAGFSQVNASYTYGKPGSIAWKISMKYPVTLVSVSKLFLLLLPFYYIVAMPFCLILNLLDVKISHREGTGLLVIALKNR